MIKVIRWVLLVIILLLAIRLGFIYRERNQRLAQRPAAKPAPLNPDYYVIPKKLNAYSLETARKLEGMTVWIREGYRLPDYPYNSRSKTAALDRPAGLLGPIEKIEVKRIFEQRSGSSEVAPNVRLPDYQVLATFESNGQWFAFPIGARQGNDYQIFADDMLFLQDPHQLYNFWPADVWQAIGQHEVKPGMNELQASFAVGVGIPGQTGTPGNRSVHYPNGGHPMDVTYQDGKAVNVKPAGPASASGAS